MSGRTPRILIDTLPWIYFVLGHHALDASFRTQIEKSAKYAKLFLSAASLAECAALAKSGKLTLQQPCEKWLEQAVTQSKALILPIDHATAVEAEQLPKAPGGLHGYEKMILATARLQNMSLLSKRRAFLDYANTGFVTVKS